MAGSLIWHIYETDLGDTFHMLRDESNGAAVGNIVLTAVAANPYSIPGTVRPRAARYRSADGDLTRNIDCSTPAILANAPDQITADDGTGTDVDLFLIGRDGERILRGPFPGDTGLTD